MATNAFLALGCLARQRQCKTVASGSNSGTSVFVGVLTIDLHPANKPNTSVEPFPHTRTCEAHATVIKGTALAPCGQRLHPSVDRRAPVCWCNHGKHTGARRPTLGAKPQFAPPTRSLGGELACASQAFVRKGCAKCMLGLFAERKPVVRAPTNILVPEL